MTGQTAAIVIGATACIMVGLLAGAAGMSNTGDSGAHWGLDGCFVGDVRGGTGLSANIGAAKKYARSGWRGAVRRLPGSNESATVWDMAKDHDYHCGTKNGAYRCLAIARPCLGGEEPV